MIALPLPQPITSAHLIFSHFLAEEGEWGSRQPRLTYYSVFLEGKRTIRMTEQNEIIGYIYSGSIFHSPSDFKICLLR